MLNKNKWEIRGPYSRGRVHKQESSRKKGLIIDFLHGGLRQRKRIKILEKFRNRQISLLVVTDVLGRGIHVDNVDYVINRFANNNVRKKEFLL